MRKLTDDIKASVKGQTVTINGKEIALDSYRPGSLTQLSGRYCKQVDWNFIAPLLPHLCTELNYIAAATRLTALSAAHNLEKFDIMGLNFDETDVSPGSEGNPGMMAWFGEFSQHCDALLHGQAYQELGFTMIPNEFRVLEQKGYYVPNFYMVKPLHYVGIEKTPIMCKDGAYVGTVKDGAIFIVIPDNEENLDDLSVRIAKEHDPDIIESLPVVLFRRCRKPIDRSGRICNDWNDDWSERLHCKNDTSEFIGVFKAQRKGESGGNNVYKMTKIFDRYYFDTTKIQTEKAESH